MDAGGANPGTGTARCERFGQADLDLYWPRDVAGAFAGYALRETREAQMIRSPRICSTGRWLGAFLTGTFLSVAAQTVRAQQDYPSQPVTIVVPWGAGGSGDITARTFARYLEKQTKGAVVVENRAGANGIIGTQAVKNAKADGYTLMITSNMTHAANATLYKKLPYEPIRDFEHIGLFGVFGLAALVTPGSAFKSIPELVAYAKANPGKVSIGYSNTSTQIAAELLKADAGIPVESVPYKAIGNAFTDLLGGHIQVIFADYVAASSHVASGKLVPIGVSAAERYARWSQVPAIAEYYAGYQVISSLGLAAPAGTPKQVVNKLNGVVTAALADPEVKGQLENLGYSLHAYTAEQTRAFLVGERDRWAKYIVAAKIEPQ